MRTVMGMLTQQLDDAVRHGAATGPWKSGFWVDVPFPVRSKSNFRRFADATDTWSPLANFEDNLASVIAALRPPDWDLGVPGAKVAKRPPVVAVIAAKSNLDAANLSKSVLDALEGVLYVTDAQVHAPLCIGERGSKDPWFSLAFAQLAPGAEFKELCTAALHLLEQWARTRPWWAASDAAAPRLTEPPVTGR